MLVLKEHNHYYYPGCHKEYLFGHTNWDKLPATPKVRYFNNNKEAVCFEVKTNYNDENVLQEIKLETSYYIGLQYIKEWQLPILIEPKVNTKFTSLHFYKMLSEALTEPENFNHLQGLMDIDFKSKWIEVPPKNQVELTPFLVIQFLMAVKELVKRGLKKSYYKKVENLRNRVKGKILVGPQIKQNIFKHRLTHTVCSYQEFGFNTPENRFIKHVLQFVYAYLSNYKNEGFKTQLKELLNYNLAAFHQVGEQSFVQYSKKETNPFYKIYNTAFNLGNQILKLISHSYEKSTEEVRKYPPHWINMSKLFELYVFKKLRERFPGPHEVKYHIKAHYQELDYIINSNGFKAVVDAKYKPRYSNGNPSKEDARQVSGYARLNSIYRKLEIDNDNVIPIYFVYPKGLAEVESNTEDIEELEEDLQNNQTSLSILSNEKEVRSVRAYKKMYLQEISLPEIFR